MLGQCLDYVREGDVLVVLDQNIDTSDATGWLLFNMLGTIGQFETEIRAERQMGGIRRAKDRGARFGKRPALTADQVAELRIVGGVAFQLRRAGSDEKPDQKALSRAVRRQLPVQFELKGLKSALKRAGSAGKRESGVQERSASIRNRPTGVHFNPVTSFSSC